MKTRRLILSLVVILLGVAGSLAVLTAFAGAVSAERFNLEAFDSAQVGKEPSDADVLPLRFPYGDWPWFAQDEIFISPEPPMPDGPVEICVEVVNDDPINSHQGLLQFGVAPLGIGVPFNTIDARELLVAAASTCLHLRGVDASGSGVVGV